MTAPTPLRPVSDAEIRRYAPGQEERAPLPGDIGLTRNDGPYGWIIRQGQRIRIHGDDRRYTWTNHVFTVVSDQGDLVEALGSGVVRSHLSRYRPADYVIVRIDASEEDRRQMVAYAESQVGARYGWLGIASIGVTLLTGAKLCVCMDGQRFCSQLATSFLERGAFIPPRDAIHMAPADLAFSFGVVAPLSVTGVVRG